MNKGTLQPWNAYRSSHSATTYSKCVSSLPSPCI